MLENIPYGGAVTGQMLESSLHTARDSLVAKQMEETRRIVERESAVQVALEVRTPSRPPLDPL